MDKKENPAMLFAEMQTKKVDDRRSFDENLEEMGYEAKDVVSTWIKSMRLGRVDDAIYWYTVMEKAGVSWWYLGRRIVIFAYEDCFGSEPAIYANAAFEALELTKGDENILFAATEYMCRAPKFWESKEGQEREHQYWSACKAIKEGRRRAIPQWAMDKHCHAGWEMKKKLGYCDERFSGNAFGRISMIKMYNRLGRLDPNDEQSLRDMESRGKAASMEK